MSLAQQVHIDIDSFDKTVIYYDLKVELALAGHLTFSFLWRHTDMVITSQGRRGCHGAPLPVTRCHLYLQEYHRHRGQGQGCNNKANHDR